MALGASKPSRQEEFLSHRDLSRRLKRSLYFGGKVTEEAGSLPLMTAASRVFSGRPGRQLRSLALRDVTTITHQACISPAAVVMAMVYLERLAGLRPDYLQRAHPKHLFVSSALAASKMLYDDGEQEQVFNDEWAASADMTVDELNAAEIDFLNAMNWQLYVPPDMFSEMLDRVEAGAALAESSRRGWLTYSDLLAIGHVSNLSCTMALLKDALLKVVAVCSVAYLASVLTLMSSVLLVFHAPPPPAAPLAVPAPAVFVARAPAAAGPSSVPPPAAVLLDQLRAVAASSGLVLLAALTPLTTTGGRQTDGHADNDTDRPDASERLTVEDDGGDARREDAEAEVSADGDRRLSELNETWEAIRSPPPDLSPWKSNIDNSLQLRLILTHSAPVPRLTLTLTDPPEPPPAVTTDSRRPWELANKTTASSGACRDTGPAGWPGLGMVAVCS